VREATSPAYRRAARAVRDRFRSLGYRTAVQPVPIVAGANDDIPVEAGVTLNVIATPPGYRPWKAHTVVGAHLDTAPDAPGANDNASGVAAVLELARLAAGHEMRLPSVFVVFGAEERRLLPSGERLRYQGSAAYVESLSRRERRAIRGMLNLDMIGNGDAVHVLGAGSFSRYVLARAERAGIPARADASFFYSDHLAFAERGVPVAWLWAGEHATLHTPSDVPRVVERGMLKRAGTLALRVLLGYRG